MRTLSALTALVTLLLTTACASGSRVAMPTVPPDRAASLTVIRPSTVGGCCAFAFFVDDHKAATLGVRDYATVVIPAGARIIAWQYSYGLKTVTVAPAPGEHVYVVMDVGMFSGSLQVYPAALGREMISGLKQVQ